jgi:hypothetical protein
MVRPQTTGNTMLHWAVLCKLQADRMTLIILAHPGAATEKDSVRLKSAIYVFGIVLDVRFPPFLP